MGFEISTLKRTISALGLAALLLVSAGSTAFAHRTGRQHNHGRHLGWAHRDENRDRRVARRTLQSHQRIERRTLREHQHAERRDVRERAQDSDVPSSIGTSMRDLGRHQRQEREDVRTHQSVERDTFKSHHGRGHGRP